MIGEYRNRHPQWDQRIDDLLVYRLLVEKPTKTIAQLAEVWRVSPTRVQQLQRRVRHLLRHDPIVMKPDDELQRVLYRWQLEELRMRMRKDQLAS